MSIPITLACCHFGQDWRIHTCKLHRWFYFILLFRKSALEKGVMINKFWSKVKGGGRLYGHPICHLVIRSVQRVELSNINWNQRPIRHALRTNWPMQMSCAVSYAMCDKNKWLGWGWCTLHNGGEPSPGNNGHLRPKLCHPRSRSPADCR